MSDLIAGLLAGFGGTAVILGGLVVWLGKVFAARIAEADSARHARELELLRAAMQLQNVQQQRISNEKWELYMEVWGRLQDINTLGDRLWERATIDQLGSFLNALAAVRVALNRGRLILQDHHFNRLNELLAVFENYQVGKKRLIEIRTHEELQENFGAAGEDGVHWQIRQNGALRAEYHSLLNEIAVQFKAELGIDAQQSVAADSAGLETK